MPDLSGGERAVFRHRHHAVEAGLYGMRPHVRFHMRGEGSLASKLAWLALIPITIMLLSHPECSQIRCGDAQDVQRTGCTPISGSLARP